MAAGGGPGMDAVASLASGFGVALRPENLLFALAGCVIGTVVGVLPGIGPIAGMAILLPVTFRLDATGAIIMLAAIYYGAMYGGTITSVLLNVPGEGASAVTAIDGYQMARQGRAGAALAIAAIGSFVGGTLATVALVIAAPPLASVALRFGPPEFFGLMMLGLTLLVGLSGGSVLRGLVSGAPRPGAVGAGDRPRRGHAAAHVREPRAARRRRLRAGHHGPVRHRGDPVQRGRQAVPRLRGEARRPRC